MDPTAPNNRDPKSPNSQKSPLEPGQFVTAGEEENGVFKQPPAPQPEQTSASDEQPQPKEAPRPPTNLASQTPSQPGPTSPSAPQPAAEPPQFANQPSPTPYVPPSAKGSPPPSPPSAITKLRIVLIILGFLLLVLALSSVAWFFIFSKTAGGKSTKVESQTPQVEFPSPPPARSSGGFSELPQATEEAGESTPSGE
ncbi:hypothetical protein HYZ70_02975 [Candidatus Curtissbacteria bacterium]|nr:hypothetical protein [Candidatus Curtissbacteria bacterium]